MADLALFRAEVYEKLGEILDTEGDEGFITKGPDIVKAFYDKYPEFFDAIETLHATDRYTRKKVICDDGKHAVRCMEWAPESQSPPHEHGKRPCFDIVLSGELEAVDVIPMKQGDGEDYILKEVKKYGAQKGEFIIVNQFKGDSEAHIIICPKGRSKSLHFYPVDHQNLAFIHPLMEKKAFFPRSGCVC